MLKIKKFLGGMPPNPPKNARDMSSTCAGRPLSVLHNFPFFSLLLSIMPMGQKNLEQDPQSLDGRRQDQHLVLFLQNY